MFQIDFASREPIYEQIYNSVIKLASAGVIKSNDKLPPVRTLAGQLGINPNTVVKAYHMLENDGYIYSTVGRGSFLTDKLSKNSAQKIMAIKEFKEAVQKAKLFGIKIDELLEIISETERGVESVD